MGKLAFLFPGQGAQAVGMGRGLCQEYAAARAVFEAAERVLGYDLAAICFDGPAERLNSTAVSQPAIYTASWAALEVLRQQEPELLADCQAAAGLSLGEYTALAFAGAFSFEDGLRLVQRRGQAMQEASERTEGGMVSVLGLDRERVEGLCQRAAQFGHVAIANLLGPGNLVVSGQAAALEAIVREAEQAGAMKVVRLTVAGAFHTELMRPADEQLAAALAEVAVRRTRIPVLSNVEAAPHGDPASIRQLLVRQVLEPVLWEQSMRRLLADGFDRFYEIGPGRVLRGLLRRIERRASCQNVPA